MWSLWCLLSDVWWHQVPVSVLCWWPLLRERHVQTQLFTADISCWWWYMQALSSTLWHLLRWQDLFQWVIIYKGDKCFFFNIMNSFVSTFTTVPTVSRVSAECTFLYLMLNGVCKASCPLGYYEDMEEGRCGQCHPTCGSCSGPLADDCETCSTFSPKLYKGACSRDCPTGTYYETVALECQGELPQTRAPSKQCSKNS